MLVEYRTRTWRFTSAFADATPATLITPTSTQRVDIGSVKTVVGNSTTGDVSVRLVFSTGTTLPTLTADSTTGVDGEFFSHDGVAKGGGGVDGKGALGALGEKVLMGCSAAPGGGLRIILNYRILETA